MAVVITAACVAVVGAAVVAVVVWMLLHRSRSRNMEPSDHLSKVCALPVSPRLLARPTGPHGDVSFEAGSVRRARHWSSAYAVACAGTNAAAAVQDDPTSGGMSASSALDSHKAPLHRQPSTPSFKGSGQGHGATGDAMMHIGDSHHDASSFASHAMLGPRVDTSGSQRGGSAPSTPAGPRAMLRSLSVGGAVSSWGGAAHTLPGSSRPQSARCASSIAASTAAAAAAAAAAASGVSMPLCSTVTVTSPSAVAAGLPGAPPVQLTVPRRKPAYWHSLHALQSYETSQSDILPRSHSAQVLGLDQLDSSPGSSAGGMRRISSVRDAVAAGAGTQSQMEYGSVGGVYRPARYVPGMRVRGTADTASAYGLPQPRSVGEMQRYGSMESSLSGSLEGADGGRGKAWGMRGGGAGPPRLDKHVEGTAAEERGFDLGEVSGEDLPGAGRTDIAEMVMSASVGGRSSVQSGKGKATDGESSDSGVGPHAGFSPRPALGVLLDSSGRRTQSKLLDNPLIDTEERLSAEEAGRTVGTTMMIAREMRLDGGTAVVDGAARIPLQVQLPVDRRRLDTA